MNQKLYQTLLRDVIPSFDGNFEASLKEFYIDSFDLLSLRANLQEKLGHIYSDSEWISIKHFSDFLSLGSANQALFETTQSESFKRDYFLNMPQMATGGLSESWYFKEIGDMHWKSIAKALDSDSDKIFDQAQNRLYATFIRIKYEATSSLHSFIENEAVSLVCKLDRFGSFFSSTNELSSASKSIKAELITSFVARGKGNTDLFKSNPLKIEHSNCSVLADSPPLLQGYHQLRKNQLTEISLLKKTILLTENIIYSTTYELNPYTDLNGVNLLYFAAYPLIFDVCERKFSREYLKAEGEWALDSSPLARDIYYLGNSNAGETLIYSVNSYLIENDLFIIQASLTRSSDKSLVAKQFCIKKLASGEKR